MYLIDLESLEVTPSNYINKLDRKNSFQKPINHISSIQFNLLEMIINDYIMHLNILTMIPINF